MKLLDGGNILYIILVILYVAYSIYKANLKKKQRQQKTKAQSQQRIPPQQKRCEQKSVKSPQMQSGKPVDNVDKYRDLWTQVQQEIEKELNRGRIPEPAPEAEKVKVTVRDYDEDVKVSTSAYENKMEEEGREKKSWLSQMKTQTAVTGGEMDETETSVRQKDVPARELMQRLHDPKNLREAVILSEILNAKY